ncbi:MAG: hypothetical protein HOE87_01040, partial [Candidatus Magasanikbacteria bacterium]|nr:hypothetical protein [Candidatus Magasanikbacteria bacterium]
SVVKDLDDAKVTGIGDYYIACGYEEYASPEGVGADLTYNQCPFDSTQEQGKNTFGVADNSCCYQRPYRVGSYPADGAGLNGDEPVCPNTLIEFDFNGEIDKNSVEDNFIIAIGHEEDHYQCGEDGLLDISDIINNTIPTIVKAESGGFLENIWNFVKRFFVKVLGGETYASKEDVGNVKVWCASEIGADIDVLNQENIDGQVVTSTIKLYIDSILPKDSYIAVHLKGGNSGITDVRGVGIRNNPDEIFDMLQDSIVFITGSEVCKIDSVEVNPEHHLFSKPNTTHEFEAIAKTKTEQKIVKIAGQYDWELEWQPQDNEIVIIPEVGFSATTSITTFGVRNLEGSLIAVANINITEDSDTEGGSHEGLVFTGLTNIEVNFCENPWPARDDQDNWSPFEDLFYNFSFSYCADDGLSDEKLDDLPFLDNALEFTGNTAEVIGSCLVGNNPCMDDGMCDSGLVIVPGLDQPVGMVSDDFGVCWDTIFNLAYIQSGDNGEENPVFCSSDQNCLDLAGENAICKKDLQKFNNTCQLPEVDKLFAVLSQDTLRRYVFFSDKNDDVFGVQIFKNSAETDEFEAKPINQWYAERFDNLAQMQTITLAGYPGLTDGRNYYVNSLNQTPGGGIYSNVYLFSVNKDAQQNTLQMFEKILNSIEFNINITDHGYCLENGILPENGLPIEDGINSITSVDCVTDFDCRDLYGEPLESTNGVCSNAKTKMFRDLSRLPKIGELQNRIIDPNDLNFPELKSGTFLPGYTVSRWPTSWSTFGVQDEINAWVGCNIDENGDIDDNIDSYTCWNAVSSTYHCPTFSSVYEYKYNVDSGYYMLHGPLEYFEKGSLMVEYFIDEDYYDTEPWCLSEAFDKPIVFSPFGEKCGDGIVNPDEQCDPPGSTVPSQTGIIGENEGTCTDGYNTQTFPIADCSSDLDCGFNYELLDGSIGYTDKNGFCTFGDEPIIDVDKSTLEKKYVFGCDQHSDCLNKNTYANRLEEGNSGLVATSIGGEEFEVGDASFDEYFLMSPAEIGCQVPSNELKEGVVCLGPEIQYQTGACPQGQIAFKSCSNSCEWEYSSCKTTYECGNAVVEQGENCDDGALNGTYGHCADENSFLGQPEKACKKLHPEYCGDGVKNYDENGSPLEFCEPADPTGKKAFIRVPHDSTYYKIADLMVSCPDVWEDGYIYDNYVQFSSLISLAPKQTDLFYGFDYLDKVFLASQNVFNNLFSIIPETVIAIDCEQDSDCNDGNSCNLDKCLANECRYAPLFDPASIPGCCADSADCDDGDINTKDMCLVGSICSYQDKVGNECGHNGDCGGSEACVEGECTEVTFCVLHSDCDDNNPATVDYCQNSICQSVGVECSVNSDCDDGISCTNDVCNNAVCSNINTPGCCNQNSDCSDGNVCTTDTCNLDTNECIYDVSADCCNVDAECDDGILCTEDVCVNHSCHSGYWDGAEIDADPSLSECCNASDKTCASGDYCTEENICAVIEGECMQQGTKEGCGSEYCNIPPGEIFGECVSCIVDSNCNDGKMCTQDSCVNNTCVNQEKLGCLTCNLDSECGDILTGNTYYSGPSDNGECREASCIAGQCRWTVLPNEIVQENGCMLGSLGCNIPGYCANDQEAGDDNKCTQDSCNDNCQIENLPYDQVGWESELNSDPECCYKDEFWKGDHCESGFCNFSSAMCIDEKEALQAFYSKLEDEVKSSCLSFNGVCSGDENIVCNSSVDCLLTSFEYSDPGSLSEFKAIYDTAYSPKGTIELGECVPVSSAYNKDKESSCSWDCQSYGIYCGDGYLQSDYEDCDDGGNENQDGCNSECLKENIACLQAGPFYNIVTTTEPIPIKSSIQITNVGECFTSTGEEICRAAKLDCIEVKILGNQKIDCDVELGDYDQTYNSLVTCAGVFIPVAQSEKEEVLGDKYCGNGVPDGTYDDEESGEEITEVCDLGDNNGIPCLPEYSDSCTYCSSDCEEVLTVDSEAYCGNGEIDLISDEDGFEACEDLSANGYILSNDDSFPFKICDDKGVYLCQNQCLNLVNNCITCGFSNDGNEAYVNLLNVVTGGSDDKVGWPVGNEISSLTFAYSSSEGIVSPTQEDVGTQGVIKSSSDSLLNLTTTGELINTDLACNKESGKSYVIQFSSQESIEPDKMFDFQVKNESEEVINEYAISPPVPEKTFRVVVKWTDENSDVDFSGIVYNEGIGLEKSISPVFLYDDILNDWGLCNDTNYPVGCGDGYSDVGVYMHPVGNLEKTYAQAITIDTNLRGNNSHNYGFVVGQSNVPFSPSVPKPAMQPYHDSNIIVEVYEYRGGDQDELSIYKPNKVFEIKNSKGSGNSSASFWHVFNLIFDEDTEEYEVVAVQEIKTGEENVWEGIPDSAVDYFGSLLSNFGQVDASNLFYQGGAIESLVALDGVTSADFMTILDYPRDVIGSQGSSDNIIFRIIKQNDYWSLANCGIDVSATECYNQSPFGDVYTLLESDVYYQDCPEEEFGCKNVQNVSFITMQEGIPYKFIVSYFYEESGLNQPMKDSLISSSPTDSFEDGIGPHSIKFYFGYQTELGLAIYGGDPNLELDYNDYGLLSDTDDEWHILNVTKTDNDLFIDFKGVLIDHPENNSEYN